MIVEKRRVDDRTVLQVEGVIKLGESARFFVGALERTLQDEQGDVLIDLSKINHIDSTGIGELVGYLGKFRERQRRMILVGPSERIRRLLRIAQLDRLFPIYGDLAAALAGERSGDG